MSRIKITEDVQRELDIATSNAPLMHARIGIVLYSYGLNEAHRCFRYVKDILIYLYEKHMTDKETINQAIDFVADKYHISPYQMRIQLNYKLKILPNEIFCLYNPIKHITLNQRFKILAEKIFEDILFELSPGYLLPIIYNLN